MKDPLVDSLYNFSYIQNPFGFAISRKSNNQVLFNTSGSTFNGLIVSSILIGFFYFILTLFEFKFEDPYLEISAQRPGKGSTYGLGERTHSVKLDLNVTYTIYNHGPNFFKLYNF